jgi:hypothetical protein
VRSFYDKALADPQVEPIGLRVFGYPLLTKFLHAPAETQRRHDLADALAEV